MGVAGADILAGEVERMVLPGLSQLGRASQPAVLVSGSGRVIASSSARILPGEVLRPAGPGRPGSPGWPDGAGWPGTMTAAGPLPWMLLGGPGGPGGAGGAGGPGG